MWQEFYRPNYRSKVSSFNVFSIENKLIKIDVYIIFGNIFQFVTASLSNLLNVMFIANEL